MTLYARTDNRRCFVSCGKELKDAGLCICDNRFTNNMWRVIDEYKRNNEQIVNPNPPDYDFTHDAPLTC